MDVRNKDGDYWISEGAPETKLEQSFLEIEEIRDFEPLNQQFGVKEKLTAPEALYETLLVSQNQQTMKLNGLVAM